MSVITTIYTPEGLGQHFQCLAYPETTKDLSRGKMFWESSFTIIIDSLSQKFMPIHSIFTYYRTATLTPPFFNSKESYPHQIRLFEICSSKTFNHHLFPTALYF